MRQDILFQKVYERMGLTTDKITIRELPKGKREDITHGNYEFICPVLMSFDYKDGGSIYWDLYMRDTESGKTFRIARFQTSPGVFQYELIKLAVQIFVDTADSILKKEARTWKMRTVECGHPATKRTRTDSITVHTRITPWKVNAAASVAV